MDRLSKLLFIVSIIVVLQLACSLSPSLSRRDWCRGLLVSGAAVVGSNGPPALAAGELPLSVRDYTKLAPLGSARVAYSKTTNLPLSEMARRLTIDLSEGATGKGGYIISGDLSTDLFRDDCVFVDPTNRVASLAQYQKALTILFDKDRSVIELVGPLTVHEDDHTIRGKFRSRGFLKLPWNPYVSAYESEIIYRIGSDDGLIYEQEQQWSKSSYTALRESFTPTIFTPPPSSQLPKPANEPPAATTLFHKLNGRRPGEYSTEEQQEIRNLMDDLVSQRVPWNGQLFPGQWKLVYFEPGEEGGRGGVDRRIPFPEFSFNDQYQVFGSDQSVQNIGELWGPSLAVRVLGSYQEQDPSSQSSPKRLQANITGGKLCWNPSSPTNELTATEGACVDLPIQGMGLFESLYLGERIRVLQNLNGTGARGIQVKMSS